jgi:hypothetical protein
MHGDQESPAWPAPQPGQDVHHEPDGSVWRWTGRGWTQVAGDRLHGEDARLRDRAGQVARAGEGFEIRAVPREAPGLTRPTDRPGAHRVYQVWWDGAGWWAQDGRWHQVDPPGTFSDVLRLHRRLDALIAALQPVNLRGVPNELAVARLLELAGDDDRLLRVALRALGAGAATDHARRLLVAALTGAAVEQPTREAGG